MFFLPYGVMVAREILVLLVWVRVLVRQQRGEIEQNLFHLSVAFNRITTGLTKIVLLEVNTFLS